LTTKKLSGHVLPLTVDLFGRLKPFLRLFQNNLFHRFWRKNLLAMASEQGALY
jgi:hypothetical protein